MRGQGLLRGLGVIGVVVALVAAGYLWGNADGYDRGVSATHRFFNDRNR